MKTLVFSVIISLVAVFSANAQSVCTCVANDSVTAVAPVIQQDTAARRTVYVEPANEKYDYVVLIVKNAGLSNETCTFVYEGKYYVGRTLAHELVNCSNVGYRVVSTVSDPASGAVHYILERRVK